MSKAKEDNRRKSYNTMFEKEIFKELQKINPNIQQFPHGHSIGDFFDETTIYELKFIKPWNHLWFKKIIRPNHRNPHSIKYSLYKIRGYYEERDIFYKTRKFVYIIFIFDTLYYVDLYLERYETFNEFYRNNENNIHHKDFKLFFKFDDFQKDENILLKVVLDSKLHQEQNYCTKCKKKYDNYFYQNISKECETCLKLDGTNIAVVFDKAIEYMKNKEINDYVDDIDAEFWADY